MKSIYLITKVLLAAALCIAVSCQNDDVEEKTVVTDIAGVAQKGPFNVGTTVTLWELNESHAQTGKSFVSQINTDDGSFEFAGVQLTTPYVVLKADGFYFDEVQGQNSAAKLTLNAIADVNDKSILNINVLTHLEKPRVEYLLANGYDFTAAKEKAKQEVLGIFNMSAAGNGKSEELDITKPGAENACLLAISAILQGYRSVADVSELLTSIASDLKEDGTLDGAALKTSLISHALFIGPEQVRQNVNNKYSGMGKTVQAPDFGQYLEQFISKTTFTPASLILYPEQSSTFGSNILNTNNSSFDPGNKTNYSMAAQTIKGIGLKIELKVLEGLPEDRAASWGYRMDKINWEVTDYDKQTNSQIFKVSDTGQPADLKITFPTSGLKIQVKYIEGNRERTRVITVL